MRLLIVTVSFMLFSSVAFASGGTCPSGANYGVNGNQTLAAIGVTSCYFVASSGLDTNTGTDESHPWLHAPFMPNCSNNCATVTSQSAGLWPGIGIILRGGDTWHFGSSTAPASGGTWEWNTGTTPVGTSSNPIYIGVDPSWYSGGSWGRPVLNGDNQLCGPGNVNGNCVSNPAGTCYANTSPASNCTGLYYVSSCPYQAGSNNQFIDMTSGKYFVIDNLEMTGLCQKIANQPNGTDSYVRFGSAQGPLNFYNLYIHGWSHLQFAAPNGQPGCNAGGAVCADIFAFQGGVITGTVGDTWRYVVVDGSDSDPLGAGVAFGGAGYDTAYCVFNDTANWVGATHLFHDNLYTNFYEDGHSNLLEEIHGYNGTNAVYNNIFAHVETSCSSGCGVGIWLAPPTTATDYIFNNLYWDEGTIEQLNIGQGGSNQGPTYLFNNTIEISQSGNNISCSSTGNSGALHATNNHFITDASSAFNANCSSAPLTEVTDLKMSHATATSDGYTAGQTYVYSPTSAGSPTVGTGTNEYSAYCGALTTAGLTDAATACESDTTYTCSYNAASHTVSCPARTVVARPSSVVWDAGAYEYQAGTNYTLTVTPAGTGSGTVTSSPAGISCGATCSASFSSGAVVTLTAAASGGSTFAGWSGSGCSGTGTCAVTMNAAESVIATFNMTSYTLTVTENGTGSGSVTSSPAGITCPSTCSASFSSGAVVTLTAAASGGSTFAGWSGSGCSGTGTCAVTMNAAESVTATFNSNPSPPSPNSQMSFSGGVSSKSACAGFQPYPCARTDLGNPAFTVPNAGGLLGANTLYVDAFNGASGVRITDYHTLGSSPVQPSYQVDPGGSAAINFMDSSDSYFYISDTGSGIEPFSWNPATMQATHMYASAYPSTSGMRITVCTSGAEFSYKVAGRMYCPEMGAHTSHAADVYSYDLTSPTPPNETLVVDLGAVPACAPNGVTYDGSVQWSDPVTVSADDQTFATALSLTGGQGTGIYVVAWNRSGTCHWWNTSTGVTDAGNVSGVTDEFYIHNVRLSLDGNWMTVSRQTCITTCTSHTVYSWQLGTTNITANAIQNSGHWTVGYNHIANDSTSPHQQSVQLAPTSSPGTNLCLADCGAANPPQYGNWDTHFSWQNANAADSNLAIGSSFVLGTEVPAQAWNNEVMGYDAKGSGTVYRFGRNYITGNTSATFAAEQGIGSVSQDGKWFAFASDWDCELGSNTGGATGTTSPYNCRADVFMLQLK